MQARGLIILGLAVVVALAPLPGNSRALQLEDYLNWKWVTMWGGDAQISPDGASVLYTRISVNLQQDRYAPETWMVNAEGSRHQRLFEKAVSAIAWSPNSHHIAYVAGAESGSSELFVRDMRDGTVVQLTHEGKTPSHLSWSPDGQWIAFRAMVPDTSPAWEITLPDKPAGAQWVEEATVIDRLHWRADGVGVRPKGYSHLFIISAQGGKPRQLTHGAWQVGARWAGVVDKGKPPAWSPDGKAIFFSADREPGVDEVMARSSLYAVDVATGTLRRITSSPEFAIQPTVSPDGRRIAYLGMDKTAESNFPTPQLRVVNIDGSGDRVLIADTGDFHFFRKHWSKDGQGLYYTHMKEGTFNVSYASLDGRQRGITSGAQSLFFTSVSDNGIAVGARTATKTPGDIVRYDLATGKNMRRLTALNDDVLKGVELSPAEEIWYDSTDNMRIQGWVVYPPDFDASKRYPLLLYIHGGPEGLYTGDFLPADSFGFQDWAAQGYVVLYTNPRGSMGYGSAFTRAIHNAWPGRGDFDDLMHGVDTVLERGFIDEDRLYVAGCSGGGALVAWVVTQTDRFAAAASLCPVTNQISMAGTSDFPVFAHNKFKQPFWENPNAWLEHSSIMHVNKVKTPTLVMVGERDLRTPVGQSEEFYTALKMRGVPTKLILLKDEGHATWREKIGHPSNFLRAQLYQRKWFSQWRRVKTGEGPIWKRSPVTE